MKINICFVFSLLSFVSLTSCNTTEPPPDGDRLTLELKLEDVSCTEAWIKLTSAYIQLPAAITLKQTSQTGETKIKILNLNTQDSLLYIDSLLPNQTYKILAAMQQPVPMGYNNASNELSITTMDTTSHNFTFQSWTFGTIGNSVLYDVAIINENNIWAVGEIYVADTSINGYTKYNAVHWDGNNWELKRILYKGGFWTIRTIFAFNEDDIWFSAFVKYDGQNFIELPIPSILTGWSINKLWGSSSSDLYAVGNNGNIAHYNGQSWQKIESRTTVNLYDVWGATDGKTVWTCGENLDKTAVLKIENNQANVVFEGTFPMQQIKNRFSDGLLSLWTDNNKFIYVLSPYNLYRCLNNTTGEGQELYPYNDYFKGAYLKLRATAINNLFTSGNKSTIAHFNGVSWKIYNELRNEDQVLRGLDVYNNLIITVGNKLENLAYDKAIIIAGKK